MNRRLISRGWCFSILLGLLLGNAGCVQVDQTLTLEPDGSGTVQIRFGVSEQATARMEQVARDSGMDPGEAGFPSTFSADDVREDFKDYEPYGVTLKSVQTETVDGWKYENMTVRFEHLDGLAMTPLLSDREVSLRRTPEGHYEFLQTPPAAAGSPDLTPDGQVQDLMKGFKAVLRIRTPGPILECNAPEHTEREAIWTFDLDKDPEAVKKAEKSTIRIVFDGKGLKIPEFQKTSTSRE